MLLGSASIESGWTGEGPGRSTVADGTVVLMPELGTWVAAPGAERGEASAPRTPSVRRKMEALPTGAIGFDSDSLFASLLGPV
jgi:hypothetical protein